MARTASRQSRRDNSTGKARAGFPATLDKVAQPWVRPPPHKVYVLLPHLKSRRGSQVRAGPVGGGRTVESGQEVHRVRGEGQDTKARGRLGLGPGRTITGSRAPAKFVFPGSLECLGLPKPPVEPRASSSGVGLPSGTKKFVFPASFEVAQPPAIRVEQGSLKFAFPASLDEDPCSTSSQGICGPRSSSLPNVGGPSNVDTIPAAPRHHHLLDGEQLLSLPPTDATAVVPQLGIPRPKWVFPSSLVITQELSNEELLPRGDAIT
ncbi:hypothetical protein OF83DRAFT_1180642 [Amylostereum chailletii]|nr:hypothetical protein OF83DRAFT_1180642 [Amylostereum chailletii]